jgi:hypothetical protein
VLTADDGRLSLGKFRSAGEIQGGLAEPVSAPEWFGPNYDFQSAREVWTQANLTPNFAAAATVFLNMFEVSTGNALDGAIAMDPITMSTLMHATGPITDPGTGEVIDPDQVDDLLLEDSYVRFDSQAQNDFIEQLVRQFWQQFRDGDVGPEVFGAIAETARGGHLMAFSSDPDEQQSIETLGVSGDFSVHGPNVQLAFNENYSVNKVDVYLHRDIDTSVQLLEDGGAKITTRVSLENLAPAGPASVLLGDGAPTPPGTNRMLQGLLIPVNGEVRSIEIEGERLPPFTYSDTGYPVGWDLVTVPPGETLDLTYRYVLEGPPVGDRGRFGLTLVPQTSANADSFSIRFLPPTDYEVTGAIGASISDGRASASGVLTAPKMINVVFQG